MMSIDNKIADKLTSGGADSILNEEGWGFRRIEGAHSIQQDLSVVNPKYGTGDEYEYNCGNCVCAYELRRRGIDVEARPREWMLPGEWAGMFDGFSQQKPTSRIRVKVVEELEQQILLWGEGARGTIYGVVTNSQKTGHFFSVEVSGGRVMFVDSQTNDMDVRSYFEGLKPSSIVYGRLDNLKPNRSIINAVKSRGGPQ